MPDDESTATLSNHADSTDSDVEMTDDVTHSVMPTGNNKFIIAVDYGTTFSAVSFVMIKPGQSPKDIQPDNIECIRDYPGDRYPPSQRYSSAEVPTELWYLDVPRSRRGRRRNTEAEDGEHNQADLVDQEEYQDDDAFFFGTAARPSAQIPPPKLYWGYQVQEALGRSNGPDPNEAPLRHIKRAKLLLDDSQHTASYRSCLKESLTELKTRKLIKRLDDAISDFLTTLLIHTKNQLELNYGFDESCDVEFVMCVPPVWGAASRLRMQVAMSSAVSEAGFRTSPSQNISNLFIVSEPEAAATYFLAAGNWDEHIRSNDTFVLLDAGGGTVDAITYTVDRIEPLRLKKEVVPEAGKLCGSSLLNESFRNLVSERLSGETYLELEGRSIARIVESENVMGKFERDKKTLRFSQRTPVELALHITGLIANEEKGIRMGVMDINRFILLRELMADLSTNRSVGSTYKVYSLNH
jgi:hypothetical protein